MAHKKQTRRSISVTGLTYQRLEAYCKAEDRSVSGLLEEIIHAKMDDVEQPRETLLRPKPNGVKHVNPPTAGGVFSW